MDPAEGETLAGSCWRAVEAHGGSGWGPGDTFASDSPYGFASLKGFERPVTFEGRVLRADGTLAFSVEPGEVALEPAREVTTVTGEMVALMASDAWASRTAVHLWGETVPTDPVVDGGATFSGMPVTLHRSTDGISVRFWSHDSAGEITHRRLALGAGERAMLAHGGMAVAVDDTLLVIGGEDGELVVRHRVDLPGPPTELVGRTYYVVAHVPGALVSVRFTSGATESLPVGEGKVLPTAFDRPPYFFDGDSFAPLDPYEGSFGFDERWRIHPVASHVAAVGELLTASHGVVIGSSGFMVLQDEDGRARGPGTASIADLFGEGELAFVADDDVTYAVKRDDGTTTIYEAPYTAFCE